MLVPDVGVGEDGDVDLLALDELGEPGLGDDRDPVRVALAGEDRGIVAAVDVGDLGRREGDDPVCRIAPEEGVEVVEVPAGCAEDDDPTGCGDRGLLSGHAIDLLAKVDHGNRHTPRWVVLAAGPAALTLAPAAPVVGRGQSSPRSLDQEPPEVDPRSSHSRSSSSQRSVFARAVASAAAASSCVS